MTPVVRELSRGRRLVILTPDELSDHLNHETVRPVVALITANSDADVIRSAWQPVVKMLEKQGSNPVQ